MAGQRDCDAVVTAGRMSKANEFFAAADHLGEGCPTPPAISMLTPELPPRT